jgi:ribonuclease R
LKGQVKFKGSGRRRRKHEKSQGGAGVSDEMIAGVISIARSGTGFVTPDEGGDDIVVPEEFVGQALNGDRVVLRMIPPRRGETRPAGKIIEIIERSSKDIVCTLRRNGSHYLAVPLLPNHKHSFHIPDAGGAKENDRVVVRFASWNNFVGNPAAEIVAVIGPADNPSLDTESIIRMYDLPGDFPPVVMREAEVVSSRMKMDDKREDLRDKLIITIDPATAKDFDDAMSLETDDEGRRVLGVHIADVSHFVTPGSQIDREARKRGTSVYLVDKVIPMLPEQLSNGVCSLVPGEDRLAFSVFLTFNAAGTMVARRFARSKIRSSHRFTYEQVQEVIDGTEAASNVGTKEVRDLILKLHKLAQRLRRNRFNRFALDISSPEMEIEVDNNGLMTGVHPSVHTTSHELVEEAMVIANEAVAIEVSNYQVPFISRYHEQPSEEKISELAVALVSLGLEPGNLMDQGNITKLLKETCGTTLEYYVSMLVLKSMKRAEYSVDNAGHYGLSKKFYSHFTSPIRRYPDLVMHRELAALLSGRKANVPGREELSAVAVSSTELEFRAEQASRDLIEIKKYRFLEQQIDDGKPLEYEAVVVSVVEFGVFVELPELQVGGLIHISQISNRFARYNPRESKITAKGVSVEVGDKLRVRVSGVDFDERKIDFTFLGT